jgi:hypothetical protein
LRARYADQRETDGAPVERTGQDLDLGEAADAGDAHQAQRRMKEAARLLGISVEPRRACTRGWQRDDLAGVDARADLLPQLVEGRAGLFVSFGRRVDGLAKGGRLRMLERGRAGDSGLPSLEPYSSHRPTCTI